MIGRRVLIVTTSHAEMGGTGHKTGVWLEELAVPYYALKDGGAEVTLASVRGGAIPFDPRSLPDQGPDQGEVPEAARRFLDDKDAMRAARKAPSVDQVAGHPCDALFLPGGHGTMWDLPDSDALALLVGSYLDDHRVVAAVCHGPAGLVRARRGDGRPVVEGKRVSAFTNSEEDGVGLREVVPFLLEDRLRELGAHYEKGPDWQPFAVRDGCLITGQNPQSSDLVAHHVLVALGLGDPVVVEEERLRERAYAIWEEEGRPHGRHEEHWARATQEAAAAIRDVNRETRLRRPGETAVRGQQPGTVVEGAGPDGPTLGGTGHGGTLRTPRPL